MFDLTNIIINGEEFRDYLIQFRFDILDKSLSELVSNAVKLEIYQYHIYYMPKEYLNSPDHKVVEIQLKKTLERIYEEIDKRDILYNFS